MESKSLLQSAALRGRVRCDFSTFKKVLNFVPKESIIREHQSQLSRTLLTPPSLIIVSGSGKNGVRMCDLLLEKCGREILLTAKDHDGQTALHVAAKSKNEPLIRLFLSKYDGGLLLNSLSQVSTSLFQSLCFNLDFTQGMTPYQSTNDEACQLILDRYTSDKEQLVASINDQAKSDNLFIEGCGLQNFGDMSGASRCYFKSLAFLGWTFGARYSDSETAERVSVLFSNLSLVALKSDKVQDARDFAYLVRLSLSCLYIHMCLSTSNLFLSWSVNLIAGYNIQ